MYHVCLYLLSDDTSILIGCSCTPLQGDWRPCMYSHRSVCLNLCVNLRSMYMYHVCLHLLSDDISILIGCSCTPLIPFLFLFTQDLVYRGSMQSHLECARSI